MLSRILGRLAIALVLTLGSLLGTGPTVTAQEATLIAEVARPELLMNWVTDGTFDLLP